MINIFSIDDHPIIPEGLTNRFRPSRNEICIAGYAENLEKAIPLIETLAIDIILLDLWLQNSDPLQNIKKLIKLFPKIPVIIYSVEESSYWIRTAQDAGAKGYIRKTASRHEMKDTIEAVNNGKTIFPDVPSISDEHRFISTSIYKLNDKERELVTYLSNGMTLEKIAAIKNQTVSAVEKKLAVIRKRIGAKNTPELIKILVLNKEIQ
jgi:two-component system, NarL family, nitrate/nitrite response regulator NarL